MKKVEFNKSTKGCPELRSDYAFAINHCAPNRLASATAAISTVGEGATMEPPSNEPIATVIAKSAADIFEKLRPQQMMWSSWTYR